MPNSATYRELGETGWAWVLEQVRDDDGPWLPVSVVAEDADPIPGEDRDSLYAGIAGLAPVLAEIRLSREWVAAEEALATSVVGRLEVAAVSRVEPSLYDGLAGDLTALRMLAPGSELVAQRRLLELMTPPGWPSTMEVKPGSLEPLTDLVTGTAGVVLAALWSGGEHTAEIAIGGCEAMMAVADETAGGLDWRMFPDAAKSSPNYSHGTAGVASALALTGHLLDRPDFIEAAQLGAQHLLSVGSLADGGFIVPHTIPDSIREVEPLTYTWCHGPTGTSHLFAALAHVGIEEVDGISVNDLRQRCFHSVLTSGVPQRLRPGFWDNDGRCCGTAGVGDVLLDAAQDSTDEARSGELLSAACMMADALVERAVRDEAGARWQFIEYRDDPPLLPPGTSWMQGAAGISAFLLRLSRALDDGLDAPVVDRPDQWWAVPASLRVVSTTHA